MRTVVFLALLLLAAGCGSNHGMKLTGQGANGTATMFHTEAVDAVLANKVFQAMLQADYNFGAKLKVQLDRVQDRLTLRTCHDNLDVIDSIIQEGDRHGVVSYMRDLARAISAAVDGQKVDLVLCRLTLADPFYTVKWQAQK